MNWINTPAALDAAEWDLLDARRNGDAIREAVALANIAALLERAKA